MDISLIKNNFLKYVKRLEWTIVDENSFKVQVEIMNNDMNDFVIFNLYINDLLFRDMNNGAVLIKPNDEEFCLLSSQLLCSENKHICIIGTRKQKFEIEFLHLNIKEIRKIRRNDLKYIGDDKIIYCTDLDWNIQCVNLNAKNITKIYDYYPCNFFEMQNIVNILIFE